MLLLLVQNTVSIHQKVTLESTGLQLRQKKMCYHQYFE